MMDTSARSNRRRLLLIIAMVAIMAVGFVVIHEKLDRRRRDEANMESIRRLMSVVMDGDVDKFVESFAKDAVMEWPFAPENMAKSIRGHDAIREFYSKTRKRAISVKAEVVSLQPLLEPDTLLIEYRETAEFDTGSKLDSRYCTIARLQNGKVINWREFFDPTVMKSANMGAMLGEGDGNTIHNNSGAK